MKVRLRDGRREEDKEEEGSERKKVCLDGSFIDSAPSMRSFNFGLTITSYLDCTQRQVMEDDDAAWLLDLNSP